LLNTVNTEWYNPNIVYHTQSFSSLGYKKLNKKFKFEPFYHIYSNIWEFFHNACPLHHVTVKQGLCT
jgi:hypothetical protein